MIRNFKISILIILLSTLLSGCYCYKSETTEIYHVKDYVIHDTGVEIWAVSKDGENNGFFVSKENVYPCEESSRVIAIYCVYEELFDFDDIFISFEAAYLYLNKEDFEKYLKELYEL